MLGDAMQGSNKYGTLGNDGIPLGSFSSIPVEVSLGGAWSLVVPGPADCCGHQQNGSGVQLPREQAPKGRGRLAFDCNPRLCAGCLKLL
jgi:hypothetical protein